MQGTLWLVGTPIGNLSDLAPRARETFASVDLIACEDTRRTGRLLAGLDIRKPLLSFFEGNERERVEGLVARMLAGASVALATDGGMPSVSDPGYRLVAACVESGIDVRVVPGPSAALAALVISGLPTDRFVFEGFLPRKAGERMRRLEALRDEQRTMVVFESPVRVRAMLDDALVALGDRRIAVARELTKLHEEVLRGRIAEVLAHLGETDPKGEVVVVIEGRHEPEVPPMDALVDEARALVDTEAMRKRDAARLVAARHGAGANDVYRAMLEPD
ncbi:MAG TPA: 16S rRNA (cytidine(1402)-2'-O)-methyltransferase [Actinomycetota bacterium]